MSIAEQLTTIAENVPKVYEAGYEKGKAEGGSSDIDEYRIALWNGIQDNGDRTDYQHAFRGWKNADKYWKPIYDIKATTYAYAFYLCDMNGASLPDLCEQAGITIDYSKSSNANQCFSYCNISDVGTIDTRNWLNVGSVLMYATTVKKAHLILKDDGSQSADGSFSNATSLTDLTISGVLGRSCNVGFCPLSKQSIESVMNALKEETTGQTVTFKKTAVDRAFETSAGAADGSASAEWTNLVAAHSNWTISLV